MSNETQAQITQLRASNIGYKRIAEILGISPNTVKSFCRRKGLFITASPLSPIPDETTTPPHSRQGVTDTSGEGDACTCRQCEKQIDQTPGRKAKRFCSDACRMKWWHAHNGQMAHLNTHTVICPGCGIPFEAYGAHPHKYCCRACYVKHRFSKETIHT